MGDECAGTRRPIKPVSLTCRALKGVTIFSGNLTYVICKKSILGSRENCFNLWENKRSKLLTLKVFMFCVINRVHVHENKKNLWKFGLNTLCESGKAMHNFQHVTLFLILVVTTDIPFLKTFSDTVFLKWLHFRGKYLTESYGSSMNFSKLLKGSGHYW